MKLRNTHAFVGVDVTISILAVLIFTGLIVSLMYNNLLTDLKSKKQAYATIYLTETLENIAIANYEDVIIDNINNFIPQKVLNDENYTINLNIEELYSNVEEKEKIIKKITATILYNVNNKTYQETIQRMKIKD